MYFWRPALSQQGHSVTTYEGSRDKNIGNGMDWLKRAHHIENRGHALQDRMRALEMDVALLRPPTSLPEVLQELEDGFACAAQNHSGMYWNDEIDKGPILKCRETMSGYA